MNDIHREGLFEWEDKSKSNWFNFSKNQPDNYQLQASERDGHYVYGNNDSRCTMTKSHQCGKKTCHRCCTKNNKFEYTELCKNGAIPILLGNKGGRPPHHKVSPDPLGTGCGPNSTSYRCRKHTKPPTKEVKKADCVVFD